MGRHRMATRIKWFFVDGYIEALDRWKNFAGTREGEEAAQQQLESCKQEYPKITQWRIHDGN
jgi:long-subunit acyl-CoA synthetase (AMP-forming)